MWNPSAFIEWQKYCRNYEHNQRLNVWSQVIEPAMRPLPLGAIIEDYPDYDIPP